MKIFKSLLTWSLILMLCQVTVAQEIINSAGPVVLPAQAGTTKIIASGQSLIVTSGQSVVLGPGFHAQAGSTVSIKITTSNVYPVPPTTFNINPELNWVLTRTLNSSGNAIGESKSFYDLGGQPLQTQSKSFTSNYVLASQPIYDRSGRAAIQTLPAPINSSGFIYKADFATNASGQKYDTGNFDTPQKLDNPDVIGNAVLGSLGWYYSNNNSWEPYVPTTSFPYSRTDYFKDGTEGASRTAAAGDPLRMGQGHESSGGTFPVNQELANYITIKKKFFGGGINLDAEQIALQGSAVLNASKDPQGNWGISIKDKDGKELMTALPGNWLNVSNSIKLTNYKEEFLITNGDGNYVNIKVNGSGKLKVSLSGTPVYHGDISGFNFPPVVQAGNIYRLLSDKPFSVSYDVSNAAGTDRVCESCTSKINAGYVGGQNFHYFSLTQGGNVSVTNGTVVVTNLIANAEEASLSGLSPGLYRVRVLSGEPELTYSASYGDISYNFYDQTGQLMGAIAPKGVQKLLTEGIAAYSTKDQLPFTVLYEYDRQGRVLAKTETDAGRTEYVYRKDGNIRFSQNAEQRKTYRFSYSNYDELGRNIESGEFVPGTVNPEASFQVAKSNTEVQEHPGFDSRLGGYTKLDMVMTHYDLPDDSHGVAGYIQDFVDGRVSWTDNGSSKTWYSYDEQGRPVWIIKNLIRFGSKTIDYTYDFLGSVTSVAYQKGVAGESFYHYYDYDADQRLLNVRTSRDGITFVQQARYTYYLHGPLKRLELADNLQGIDYTYTAQGMLKAINHPLTANDPGHDGQNGFAPDAFGMTLEYFSGDYTRSNTGIASIAAGTTGQNFNGNISAQSWRSQKPSSVVASYGASVNNPAMFTYEYNNKYQFTGSKYGNPNFSANTFNEVANANREFNLSYDPNGNIQSLSRTDQAGNIKANFTGSNYHYQNNTNKLTSVDNYASYSYDDLGQMTAQSRSNGQGYYPVYNMNGKITAIYSDANHTQLRLTFSYDESGNRTRKTDHIALMTTFYISDASGNVLAIYDQSLNTGIIQQKELPIYAAEKIGMYNPLSNSYIYELSDHLGNIRAAINRMKMADGQADMLSYSDYYPFGSPLTLANNDYRYGFQGGFAELDQETGWNSFTLRMYDPTIGRWMTTDPYGQYASPYLGMGNNPVSQVDPDGGATTDPEKTYNGNGGKPLNEVVIKGKGMNAWERATARTNRGADIYKFSDGRADIGVKIAMDNYRSYQEMMARQPDFQGYIANTIFLFSGGELFEAPSLVYGFGRWASTKLAARGIVAEVEIVSDLAVQTENVSGSYLLKFESGKFYAGKGLQPRMMQSIKRIETTFGDKLISKEFFGASSVTEAFINEHKLMMEFGGPKSFNALSPTYNKIFSPGKKLLGL